MSRASVRSRSRRGSPPGGPIRGPSDALLDVGNVQVVGLEEAGHALQLVMTEPEGRHAESPMPMPGRHTTMSVTRIGPFTKGGSSSPSLTSSTSGAAAGRRAAPGDRLADGGDLPVGVGVDLDLVVSLRSVAFSGSA